MLNHVARYIRGHLQRLGLAGAQDHAAIRIDHIAELYQIRPLEKPWLRIWRNIPQAPTSIVPTVALGFLPNTQVGPCQLDLGTLVENGDHLLKEGRFPPIVILQQRLVALGSGAVGEVEGLDRTRLLLWDDQMKARIVQADEQLSRMWIGGVTVMNLANPIRESLAEKALKRARQQKRPVKGDEDDADSRHSSVGTQPDYVRA